MTLARQRRRQVCRHGGLADPPFATRDRNDVAHPGDQVEVTIDEFEQALFLQNAEGVALKGVRIAQLTLGTGAEMADADAVKKMRGVLKEARTGQTTFTPEEIVLIQDWVPASWTAEQITEALHPVRDAIKSAPKDAMALGVAMKALAGQPVESDDVKAVVATIRAAG